MGGTPHLTACSINTLSRLLHTWAGPHGGGGPHVLQILAELLPPVLELLKTRSREVVAAAIRLAKVCIGGQTREGRARVHVGRDRVLKVGAR